MTKILAFTGRKQSGKSSGAKFVLGQLMLQYGIFDGIVGFSMNDTGDLLFENEEGEHIGPFDVTSKDHEYMNWCAANLWPTVRIFSFAENLKWSLVHIFGLHPGDVFGTDEDKNKKTHIKWNNVRKFLAPHTVKKLKEEDKMDDFLTIRQLLELFGTDICRELDEDCWINATFKTIRDCGSKYVIIDDCRANNEAARIKEMGGIIIECKSPEVEGSHKIESGIKSQYIDFSVDKDTMTIDEKNLAIRSFLVSKNFFEIFEDSE